MDHPVVTGWSVEILGGPHIKIVKRMRLLSQPLIHHGCIDWADVVNRNFGSPVRPVFQNVRVAQCFIGRICRLGDRLTAAPPTWRSRLMKLSCLLCIYSGGCVVF